MSCIEGLNYGRFRLAKEFYFSKIKISEFLSIPNDEHLVQEDTITI